MFNKNFYPTPAEVIAQMLHGINLSGATVLEPSAGKGDIADYCKRNHYSVTVHCIEFEEDLCAILREKKLRVLCNNFLQFKPTCHYDYIIMNPPFDDGAAHFLHAWHIADGAVIVCLLNAETLRNPYTEQRAEALRIIEANGGEISYLGKVFQGSERSTNVDVAMVKIKKPASEKQLFFDAKILRAQDAGISDFQGTELATRDVVFNHVASLQKAVEAMREMGLARRKFQYYLNNCGIYAAGDLRDFEDAGDSSEKFNQAVMLLHRKMWASFIGNSKFKKYITTSLEGDFSNMQKEQEQTEFCEQNIAKFLDILVGTREQVIQRSIVKLFDMLAFYGDGKNKLHIAKWKTNSWHKINKKIIVPLRLSQYTSSFYAMQNEHLDDIDKCLCYITGDDFNEITTIARLRHNLDRGDSFTIYDQKHESHFFKNIRFYKKGTAHLEFKDEYVWARFNQIACKGKNWLGDGE
jgi:predicted RNA methylase